MIARPKRIGGLRASDMTAEAWSELEAAQEAAVFTARSNGWEVTQYARHEGTWFVSFTDPKREGDPQIIVAGPDLIVRVAETIAGLNFQCEDCGTGYHSAAPVVREPCERCGGKVVKRDSGQLRT